MAIGGSCKTALLSQAAFLWSSLGKLHSGRKFSATIRGNREYAQIKRGTQWDAKCVCVYSCRACEIFAARKCRGKCRNGICRRFWWS